MLSHHFRRSEFRCKCGCGQDTVDAELITVLEKIRERFGSPILITSGNRCPKYNRSVGGAQHSQHLKSRAADIQIKGITPREAQVWINKWHTGGMGRYESFTHIDTRNNRVRWGR